MPVPVTGTFLNCLVLGVIYKSTDSPYCDPTTCLIHRSTDYKLTLPSEQASSGSVHNGVHRQLTQGCWATHTFFSVQPL